jgi:phenylalanyl-tRNA synthetase alpha chain
MNYAIPDVEAAARRAEAEIEAAAASELDALRVKFLGKKGEITAFLKGLKDIPTETRAAYGQAANVARERVEAALARKREGAGPESAAGEARPGYDPTLPGVHGYPGTRHPISHTAEEIVRIFLRMGFVVADGPEVETDYYNFEALNFPPDHPARDMQDTFFLGGDLLLRTHTSPVQIRSFKKRTPPVKIVAPGRSYRNEAINARSYCLFHQVEGFYVDTDVTFGDLKGVLSAFATAYFGADVKLRFRPSYFPFTEPSTEVDVSCYLCAGRGCSLCKHEGWLEILGAGMIDPEVFRQVGYDPEKVSGYAFGMGVDRIAMLRHRITDIRLLYENDVRFLRQFRL